MKIYRTMYKDRPATAVDTGVITATFLDLDGGKMASLKDESREYLETVPGDKYRVLTYDGKYTLAECSAFDDMFPTIDPYTPESGENAGKEYPCHGEVCRRPSEVTIDEDSVTFTLRSPLFPTVHSKMVTAENGALVIKYTLENHGKESFPYIWAAHCMLHADTDTEIFTPFADDAPVKIMFGPDNAASLSRTKLSPNEAPERQFKFYYLDKISKGLVGCRYGDGKKLTLEYPEDVLPFLGIWINNGRLNGMWNIALEPCSAPFDRPDNAEASGNGTYIPAGGKVEFTLRFSVEGN